MRCLINKIIFIYRPSWGVLASGTGIAVGGNVVMGVLSAKDGGKSIERYPYSPVLKLQMPNVNHFVVYQSTIYSGNSLNHQLFYVLMNTDVYQSFRNNTQTDRMESSKAAHHA